MKSRPVSAVFLLLLGSAAAAFSWLAISSLKGAYYVDGLLVRSLGSDVEPAVLFVHQVAFWAFLIFAVLFCLSAVALIDHLDVRRWWCAVPIALLILGALLGFLDLAGQNCGQYEHVTQCVG